MTDPQAGTRAHRAEVARKAIAKYRAWQDDDQAIEPPFAAFGELVTCASWLLEMLQAGAPMPGGHLTAHVGAANTAVAHLSNRECREVLNVFAVRMPAAVIDAIAEAV